MNDENEISQGLVSIRTLVLPALLEEIVELVPFLEL
jgi:hypothetical protein